MSSRDGKPLIGVTDIHSPRPSHHMMDAPLCDIPLVHEDAVEAALRGRAGEDQITYLADTFQMLASPTRLRIVEALAVGELCVCDLAVVAGVSQSAVSHHLGMLRNAGIVEPRRDGKHNFYRILPGNFEKLLMLVFDGIPKNELAVRFSDLDLSRHRPLQPR